MTVMRRESTSVSFLIRELLAVLGEDVTREGLTETPLRVQEAMKEWFSGYDAKELLKLTKFADGSPKDPDEIIMVSNIRFYSHCEHHLAPFFGTATVAYLPGAQGVVGLSKMARIVDFHARRLQVQERLTNNVVDTLEKFLEPRGCGAILRARHLCMESRGVRMPGTVTTTSALRGEFRSNQAVRAEFLSLVNREERVSL